MQTEHFLKKHLVEHPHNDFKDLQTIWEFPSPHLFYLLYVKVTFWNTSCLTWKQQYDDLQTLAAFSALQPKHKLHPIRCYTLYWWVFSTSTLTLITAPLNRLAFTMTNSSQPRPTKTWNEDPSAPHIHQQPQRNLRILQRFNTISLFLREEEVQFSNVTNVQTREYDS